MFRHISIDVLANNEKKHEKGLFTVQYILVYFEVHRPETGNRFQRLIQLTRSTADGGFGLFLKLWVSMMTKGPISVKKILFHFWKFRTTIGEMGLFKNMLDKEKLFAFQ